MTIPPVSAWSNFTSHNCLPSMPINTSLLCIISVLNTRIYSTQCVSDYCVSSTLSSLTLYSWWDVVNTFTHYFKLYKQKSTCKRFVYILCNVGLQRMPLFSIRIFGYLNERIPNYLLTLTYIIINLNFVTALAKNYHI